MSDTIKGISSSARKAGEPEFKASMAIGSPSPTGGTSHTGPSSGNYTPTSPNTSTEEQTRLAAMAALHQKYSGRT
jgi:hypothetical protein